MKGDGEMAQRRMFSKAVTGSGRFLQLSATARLLYYDLGMQADDDGVVEAFAVLRLTGAAWVDLEALVDGGFVRLLNSDLVAHIVHWRQNNCIQKDRYHPSVYRPLLDAASPAEPAPVTEPAPSQGAGSGKGRARARRGGKGSAGRSLAAPAENGQPDSQSAGTKAGGGTPECRDAGAKPAGSYAAPRCADTKTESGGTGPAIAQAGGGESGGQGCFLDFIT